jgi:hypothetical protein
VKHRRAATINGLLIAAMFAIALFAIRELPAGGQIAIHWGPDGQPDSWIGQRSLLLVVPIVSAVLWFLLSMAPENAPIPKQHVHARFSRVFTILFAAQIGLTIHALGR